jgi:hypothetical protein
MIIFDGLLLIDISHRIVIETNPPAKHPTESDIMADSGVWKAQMGDHSSQVKR